MWALIHSRREDFQGHLAQLETKAPLDIRGHWVLRGIEDRKVLLVLREQQEYDYQAHGETLEQCGLRLELPVS